MKVLFEEVITLEALINALTLLNSQENVSVEEGDEVKIFKIKALNMEEDEDEFTLFKIVIEGNNAAFGNLDHRRFTDLGGKFLETLAII